MYASKSWTTLYFKGLAVTNL